MLCSGGSRTCLKGEAPTPKVGVLTYIFGRKLHENERIWTPRAAGVPGAPLTSTSAMLTDAETDADRKRFKIHLKMRSVNY